MKNKQQFIKNFFTYAILLFSITFFILSIFSTSLLKGSSNNFFSYQLLIVRSDSMKKTDFKAGDLIVVKKVDPNTLKVGDIITFTSKDPYSFNEKVTHKIRKINYKDKAIESFTTYGTVSNIDDKALVFKADVVGRYLFKISKLGYFLALVKSKASFFIIGIVSLIFLIIYLSFKLLKSSQDSKNLSKEEDKIT